MRRGPRDHRRLRNKCLRRGGGFGEGFLGGYAVTIDVVVPRRHLSRPHQEAGRDLYFRVRDMRHGRRKFVARRRDRTARQPFRKIYFGHVYYWHLRLLFIVLATRGASPPIPLVRWCSSGANRFSTGPTYFYNSGTGVKRSATTRFQTGSDTSAIGRRRSCSPSGREKH